VDGQGAVYVADWGNDRVQKLSPTGDHIATFGSSGSGDGQLTRPSSVAVDGDGNVYVADWGNNRVQMFASDGSHLATLLGDSGLSAWAEEGMKGNLDLVVEREGMDLTAEMRFWGQRPSRSMPADTSSWSIAAAIGSRCIGAWLPDRSNRSIAAHAGAEAPRVLCVGGEIARSVGGCALSGWADRLRCLLAGGAGGLRPAESWL